MAPYSSSIPKPLNGPAGEDDAEELRNRDHDRCSDEGEEKPRPPRACGDAHEHDGDGEFGGRFGAGDDAEADPEEFESMRCLFGV